MLQHLLLLVEKCHRTQSSVKYGGSPTTVYRVTGSHAISVPSLAILDATVFSPEHQVLLEFSLLRTFTGNNCFNMLVLNDPATPAQKSCPSLPGKGCAKCLATWDDHPLCTSCYCVAPEPSLGIFACPTCADCMEEQWLCFTNRRKYRKKSVVSPTSELDSLLVVGSAKPVISPPPLNPSPSNSPAPVDVTPAVPVPHQSSLESLLVGLSTELASLTATLHGEKGGVGQGPTTPTELNQTSMPASLRPTMRIYFCSQAVSPAAGTGAAPHRGPALDLGIFIFHRVTAPALVAIPRHKWSKYHSCTIHSTAPTVAHHLTS